MQYNPVYLYFNKLDVYTEMLGSWPTERYRRVYNRNLKIYRGVDNRIDIQVRNPDQKTSNINGSILVFNLISRDEKKLVLKKDCTAMDLTTGKCTVILTDTELLDITNGFYNYSIIKEIRTTVDSTDYVVNSKIPLYMDSQYDAVGTLEISGDVYGDVDTSLIIGAFNYTNPFTTGDSTPKWFTSSIIDAKPFSKTGNALHTFQFYSTNYTGSVVIQGNSDNQGATPRESKWIDIVSVDLETESFKNIVGKYNWFRIKHIPTGSSNTASFVINQNMDFTYDVEIYIGGTSYTVGNVITIEGNKLGGELDTNDLTITVAGVDGDGKVTSITWSGLSYPGVKTFILSGTASEIGTIDKILYR